MSKYINVLIADDDREDIDFLDEAISQIITAYQTFGVADGGECINFLKNNPAPDLIFLDLTMPQRNGLECLRFIKETESLKNARVMIYSSSHNYRDIDKCYKLGANFYIVKPVVLSAMVRLLDKLFVALGKPKAQLGAKDQFVLMEREQALYQ
jgi:CheY-like chemotaxis protein